MTKRTLGMLALALAVALLLPATSLAQIIPNTREAWNFAYPSINYTNGNWTFGEVFVPNRNLEVTYLGYYAANGVGGFASDHPVGMFDASGNLLSSTDITNASNVTDFFQPSLNVNPPTGNFAYNAVAPFWIYAGQTYVIEGVSNLDPYTWNDPGFTVYLPITILGNNWILGNGLNFNGTFLINDVSNGYWGADFAVSPEPSTFLMLGTGILGLAGMLRRKLF